MTEGVYAEQAESGMRAGQQSAGVQLLRQASIEPLLMTAAETAELLAAIDRLYAAAIEADGHLSFLRAIADAVGADRAELRQVSVADCHRATEAESRCERVLHEDAFFGPPAAKHFITLGFLLPDGSPVALDLTGALKATGALKGEGSEITASVWFLHLVPHVKRAIQIRMTIQGGLPIDQDGGEGHDHNGLLHDVDAAIEHHFMLPPSQARLMALLYQGHNIKSAASKLGITEGSARQYLKRIFEKTGARRQADLVRLAARALTHHSAGA